MRKLNKKTLQNLTLLIGILTALLLIFGTYFQSSVDIADLGLLGSIFETSSASSIKVFSSVLTDAFQALNL